MSDDATQTAKKPRSPKRDAKLEAHSLTILARLERIAERHTEESDNWNRRFTLSAGVANGAAFAGLASKMIEGKVDWLLGPLWWFFFGMILAGLVPVAHANGRRIHSSRYQRMAYEWERYRLGETKSPHEPDMAEIEREEAGMIERVTRNVTWASVACFMIGILAPMIGLTAQRLGLFGAV